jgi:hypothetical protein
MCVILFPNITSRESVHVLFYEEIFIFLKIIQIHARNISKA